jgi:hypothetical protein
MGAGVLGRLSAKGVFEVEARTLRNPITRMETGRGKIKTK